MSALLGIGFFITAILYAAVGFGGGSTYNALLVLNGTDYRILPSLALACNILVVTGGVIRFWRSGHISLKRLAPFLIASVPAALIGGRIPVSETVFIGLLGSALLLSGLRLAFQPATALTTSQPYTRANPALSLCVGGAIGFLSGLVGIGGGIFLAPILYITRWGSPRQIAAACSVFILANSISGLTGQVAKLSDMAVLSLARPYWSLLLCVLIGGQIGSWLASERLSPSIIKRLTAILILYVAARLLWRWAQLVGFSPIG
ncbi:MAG: sulfite exporter TauE/SafE family protein [Hyphomonas sp.]